MAQLQLPFGLDFITNFFSTSSYQPVMGAIGTCVQAQSAMLGALPAAYANVNAVLVNNNLAVIPGTWSSGNITSSFYDIVPSEPCVASVLDEIKAADFIAYDISLFSVIGQEAKVEKIQDFPLDLNHVHEAPVYLPETNELLYSDTSEVGFMYAINIDTHALRKVPFQPGISGPLSNINGGTLHQGQVYITTNGGPVRGIYNVDLETGKADAILNNYRGRHLNSPNDLVFDKSGYIWFTDPDYGWDSKWPSVGPPELPQAIYRFDVKIKSLTAMSNSVVVRPNGLAFSPDESILYVADSNSSSNALASQRAVFAFDVQQGGLLENPRLVHQVEGGWPDGVRVSKNGLLLAAVYGGVDVVNPLSGQVLGKINTPGDIIYNLEPARGKGVWLLTGGNHIYKVTIREPPKDV